MKLQHFLTNLQPPLRYNFEAIASDRELATQIQIRLRDLNYLDSAADGSFGPISKLALQTFQEDLGCNEPEFLGDVTAKKLIETRREQLTERPLFLSNDLASRIIKYMKAAGYKVFQGSKYLNIIYVEGLNADGTLNKDEPNQFNDRRLVIEILGGIPAIIGNWQATSEPGSFYTYHPMNAGGVARVAFGQYQAWQVGIHGNAEPHEALVQVEPINIYRDSNRDFQRTGDKLVTGLFGINQHWGYDMLTNDVRNASAGCLVGRTRQGHREFMALIKSDRRYQANPEYVFWTTIIPGDKLGQ